MPRLLQVTTIPLTMEAFLLPYGMHFRQKGWIVHGAAAQLDKSSRAFSAFDRCFDLPFSRDPRKNNLSELSSAIRELVLQNSYDIVHVHTPIASFVTRFALRKMHLSQRRPAIIYTAHGFHFHRFARSPVAWLYKAAERLAARWTDYLIVINQEDFRAAAGFMRDSNRLRQFPGIGIDLQAYSRSAVSEAAVADFRASLGIAPESRVLLTVGELNPGKRHGDAILALRASNSKNVHLIIAGEGPMRQQLVELAREKQISDRVHLVGFRNDIPVVLKSSSALLVPSEREGLSRSVMEAMALQVPVIGSNARGVEDLLQKGAGLIFPVGDVLSLASAIDQLLSEGTVSRRLVETALNRLHIYSLPKLFQLHESLYNEALSPR